MHLIKRELFPLLLEHLEKPEMTIIVGPRQAGKTSLMQDLAEHLQTKGERTLFLNLDIEDQAVFFETQAALVARLKAEFGNTRGSVFIDEIQRKKNAGLFLKGLYDMNLPYKFVISGSGSLELKESISESMVGRKQLFPLNTLSFLEYANFKTAYRYVDRLDSFLRSDKALANQLLNQYLIYGGYPRVVLAEDEKEKRAQISEILTSFLEKDIASLLGVGKRKEFLLLMKLLSVGVGQLTNFSSLANLCGLEVKSVKKYLWYLEKIFIVQEVRPFAKNKRLEISHSPSYYFKDLGLRQFLADRFFWRDLKADPLDSSFVFQNFVFGLLTERQLKNKGLAEIHFWRTKSGGEVDFTFGNITNQEPVEVKFSYFKAPVVPRGLASFIEKYNPKHAWVVNLNFSGQKIVNKATVDFMPWFDFLASSFLTI